MKKKMVVAFGISALIVIALMIFHGRNVTLAGLFLATCIYAVTRWSIGYPDWDNYDGPLRSVLATLAFLLIFYVWGSAFLYHQNTIRTFVQHYTNIFVK